MLIEPVPHRYLECAANRGQANQVFCNACVPSTYTQKYVDMCYVDLMTLSENLELDMHNVNEHVERGKTFLAANDGVVRFGAVAATLNNILQEAAAPPSIDLLSLDVEGAELDVLRGVNFDQYAFKFILVECRAAADMINYLVERGYEIVDMLSKHDYLFSSNK